MTKELYSSDSYIKAFEATVIDVNQEDGFIVLDQTAFFPGGGGQPCDFGMIRFGDASCRIEKVKKQGSDIAHYTSDTLPEKGVTVSGEIDWQRRYQLMKMHTTLHLMCGVIWRDYQARVTGGNMEPGKGRLDFELESFSAELVKEIEEKINQEVENSRPISVSVIPREEAFQIPDLIRTKINLLPESLKEIRVVSIDGLDLQADGGTHVSNTKEIGTVKIVKHKSKGKINKRIEIAIVEGD